MSIHSQKDWQEIGKQRKIPCFEDSCKVRDVEGYIKEQHGLWERFITSSRIPTLKAVGPIGAVLEDTVHIPTTSVIYCRS
jgi:hypothetical protein